MEDFDLFFFAQDRKLLVQLLDLCDDLLIGKRIDLFIIISGKIKQKAVCTIIRIIAEFQIILLEKIKRRTKTRNILFIPKPVFRLFQKTGQLVIRVLLMKIDLFPSST